MSWSLLPQMTLASKGTLFPWAVLTTLLYKQDTMLWLFMSPPGPLPLFSCSLSPSPSFCYHGFWHFPKTLGELRAFVLAIPAAWNALLLISCLPCVSLLNCPLSQWSHPWLVLLNCHGPSTAPSTPSAPFLLCLHCIFFHHLTFYIFYLLSPAHHSPPTECELHEDKEFCLLLIFMYLWLGSYLSIYLSVVT